MIDINEQFETSTMSDVAYHALKTFAENDLDISYLNEVNQELENLKKEYNNIKKLPENKF